MRFTESRMLGGPGIQILRHDDFDQDGWTLDLRACILITKVAKRLTAIGKLGHYQNTTPGNDDTGDLNWAFYWLKDTREISAWSFGTPVVITDKPGPGTGTGGGGGGGGGGAGGAGATFTDPPPLPDANAPGVGSGAAGGGLSPAGTPPPGAAGGAGGPAGGAGGGGAGGGAAGPNMPGGGGGAMAAACPTLTQANMIPAKDETWQEDLRFHSIKPNFPQRMGMDVWPKFPLDYVGLAHAASNEKRQVSYFLPIDPRLIAPNIDGDPETGTLVVDLDGSSRIDPVRMARLQSHFRVIKDPTGCISWFGENTIALQIGPSGCGDVRGGMVFDADSSSGSATGGPGTTQAGPGSGGGAPGSKGVAAMLSQRQSGFIEVECTGKHLIGKDADGHPIHATHLSLNSYFTFPGGVFDGPLKHDGPWDVAFPAPYPVEVEFQYDANLSHPFVCGTRKGKQRWRSFCFWRWTDDPEDPRVPEFPELPENPPVETGGATRPELNDEIKPGELTSAPLMEGPFTEGAPNVLPRSVGTQIRRFASSTLESMVGSMLARPQFINSAAVDLRRWATPSLCSLIKNDNSAPVVARIEPWGKQGIHGFLYNERPGRGIFPGGTGIGGFLVMPGEFDMGDEGTNFAPNGRPQSLTYFSVLFGNFFGAGLPDVDTGEMKRGYRWGADSNGELGFDCISADGLTTTRVLTLRPDDRTPGVDECLVRIERAIELPVLITTGAVTLGDQHHTVKITNNAHGITLPPAVDAPGRVYQLKHGVAGSARITPDATIPDTIDGAGFMNLTGLNNSVELKSDGISDWMIF